MPSRSHRQGKSRKLTPLAERADLAPKTDSTDMQLKQRDPRYQVRSDVIEMKFKFSPEFDQLTVQPDGFAPSTSQAISRGIRAS